MTAPVTGLLLLTRVLADTGQVSCPDLWGGINPTEITAYANGENIFRVVVGDRCRHEIDCDWRLDRGAGTLSATTGTSVTWYGPTEPPEDCVPDHYRVYVSCRYREHNPRQDQADILLRCTDEERAEIQDWNQSAGLEGGGCGSAPPVAALLLFPLGAWRRRSRTRAR